MGAKDPDIDGFRELLKAMVGEPGGARASIEEQRAGNDAWGLSVPLPNGCGFEELTVDGVAVERLTPQGADPTKVILYLHGGGYVAGSSRSHRHYVARLAQAAGTIALNVDYRLAPEHPYPAAVEDATAAYRWLLAQGFSADRIVVAGDSAGGGLTLATALALKAQGAPLPAALYPISPWTDLAQSGAAYQAKIHCDPMITIDELNGMSNLYRAGAAVTDPLVSPVHGDLAGLPPILIHVGSEEALLTDSTALAERAALAGVSVRLEVWPEMIHVWPIFHQQLAAGRRAIDEAGAWIARQVAATTVV
ncbi:MAG: alpha/beta hydrolase [Caulobacteraceae bacterium]|nr:alpha/beta hydrolase [Caulobacteraceae bacterium]